MASAVDFDSVAALVGAPGELTDYLKARGITNLSVLALLANTPADVTDKITKRFIDGVTIKQIDHKCTEDADVTVATMIAMWDAAKAEHERNRATSTPAATGPAPPSSAPSIIPTKIPTTLPIGVWAAQINKYNNITVAGVEEIPRGIAGRSRQGHGEGAPRTHSVETVHTHETRRDHDDTFLQLIG